jgi:argininosuccinate lyase
MAEIVAKAHFNVEEMKKKSTLDYAGSSEAHDRLVYDFGVPFRSGHRMLGAMVRADYLGEEMPDLNAMIREELGRDVNVDQNEIMDIVTGRKLSPSTFDVPMLRENLAGLEARVTAAERALPATSPVEQAIDKLLGEARAYLTR